MNNEQRHFGFREDERSEIVEGALKKIEGERDAVFAALEAKLGTIK